MSRLDSLPPDMHAVLSLLLRQRKSYAEIAVLLAIEERAVHDRAHAALALLAPRQARELTAAEREQIGEYLLGQQGATRGRETRALLSDSAPGRTWAQALAVELAPLSAQPLPEIPARPRTAARPREGAAEQAPAPSSRVGGAVLLGGLAAVVIVVVLLIIGVGGSGGSSGGTHTSALTASGKTTPDGSQAPASGADAKTHTTATPGTSTSGGSSTGGGAPAGSGTSTSSSGTATGSSQPATSKPLTLTPPDPATSKAIGIAYVLTQKGAHAFYVFTKGLPTPAEGAFYAIWLEGPASVPAYPLGSLPTQNANGLVEGGGPLPSNAGSYNRIIVTRETNHHPVRPGPTVLGGAFSLT